MTSNITHKYAIKTGSTDNDSWVIGYTPDVVFTSWAGYDDNSNIPLEVIAGNKSSWVTSMEYFFKDKDSSWYKIPQDVVGVLVNPITGNVVKNNDENKKVLYYLKGTEPSLMEVNTVDKQKEIIDKP